MKQTMPVGISPIRKQASAHGAVRGGERRIGTLHQVPCQQSCAARRIEPTLRLHDDAPSQALAGFSTKSSHDSLGMTRRAYQLVGGAVRAAAARVRER